MRLNPAYLFLRTEIAYLGAVSENWFRYQQPVITVYHNSERIMPLRQNTNIAYIVGGLMIDVCSMNLNCSTVFVDLEQTY